MKLVSSPTSPYAQKVRVVALEKGINLDIENVAPLAEGSSEKIRSPLGKVPTLILDNGDLLFDSVVICAYLDALNGDNALNRAGDWHMQRNQALGDGIMDSAFSMVMERNRTDTKPSEFWLARWQTSIERSVAEIAKVVSADPEAFNLGTIALTCALNYLGFRLPEITWQTEHPNLNDWHQKQLQRPSYQETQLG